jgi:zinc-ribbon domain
MALIDCPSCGHKVSSKADACPSCGHPITPKNQRGFLGCVRVVVGVFVVLIIIGLIADWLEKFNDRPTEGHVITAPAPMITEPQASPPGGKDCSGIPRENRTLDCAP